MSDRPKRRCVFISNRVCQVDADEIPLEVCRLCLEAWKAENENTAVKRSIRGVETPGIASAFQKPPIQTQPLEKAEREVSVEPEPERALSSLSELDRLFAEGEIELDEYVKRRKSIVNSVKREKSPFATLEGTLKNFEQGFTGIVLVEKEKAKATYPENWTLPGNFKGRVLKSVYELCKALNEQSVNMRLQIGDFKVTSLGYKDEKLILLFLDSNQGFEDYEEGIREARSELERRRNWEEILPKLYKEYFQIKQLPFTYTS